MGRRGRRRGRAGRRSLRGRGEGKDPSSPVASPAKQCLTDNIKVRGPYCCLTVIIKWYLSIFIFR